uniref:Retrotransposon gag domain-containing protein n=1 Tax=Photinus pyralis TaxID=7054 RepID=A0A1Y1MD74_PHOPY
MGQMMERLTSATMPPPTTPIATTYHVMPDLTKGVGTYNGEKYGTVAKEWLHGIKASGSMHRWSDEVKLETARIHLRGAAKAWHDARDGQLQTWENFEHAFEKTFCRKASTTELWEAMRTRTQRSKEDISTYFHEKYKMCRA